MMSSWIFGYIYTPFFYLSSSIFFCAANKKTKFSTRKCVCQKVKMKMDEKNEKRHCVLM